PLPLSVGWAESHAGRARRRRPLLHRARGGGCRERGLRPRLSPPGAGDPSRLRASVPARWGAARSRSTELLTPGGRRPLLPEIQPLEEGALGLGATALHALVLEEVRHPAE